MLSVLKLASVNAIVCHVAIRKLTDSSFLQVVQRAAVLVNGVEVVFTDLRNVVSGLSHHSRQPDVLLVVILARLLSKVVAVAQRVI